MHRLLNALFKLACLGVCLSASMASAFAIPPLTTPVIDTAGMLDSETKQVLNNALHALRNQGGSQVAILTVPELGGESIEQASIKVVDVWQLGSKQQDNGVLLFIAKADRKLRIEVGQGLEGVLPDVKARRIIDQTMVPLMRQQDANGAVLAGVYQIVHLTDPQFDIQAYLNRDFGAARSQQETPPSSGHVLLYIFLIIVVLPLILLQKLGFINTRSWGGGYSGGSSWGGSSSGGFGGGGGFSGGGGGFSGGGASGEW